MNKNTPNNKLWSSSDSALSNSTLTKNIEKILTQYLNTVDQEQLEENESTSDNSFKKHYYNNPNYKNNFSTKTKRSNLAYSY